MFFKPFSTETHLFTDLFLVYELLLNSGLIICKKFKALKKHLFFCIWWRQVYKFIYRLCEIWSAQVLFCSLLQGKKYHLLYSHSNLDAQNSKLISKRKKMFYQKCYLKMFFKTEMTQKNRIKKVHTKTWRTELLTDEKIHFFDAIFYIFISYHFFFKCLPWCFYWWSTK